MKGLLIKDFRLMKVQRNFWILILAIGIAMALFGNSPSAAIGFPTLILALFSFSSISYDEFDNGNAFLFSLPVTRKGYVVEKYCFGLILGAGNWAAFSILIFLLEGIKKTTGYMELLMISLLVLPLLFLMLSIMLPAILKFGSEKGRIVLIAVFVLIGLLGAAVNNLAKILGADLAGAVEHMTAAGLGIVIAGVFLFSILILAASMGLSVAIVRKKEF